MDKTPDYYRQLLEKWIRNELSPQEAIDMMDHLQKDASSRLLLQKMQEEFRGSIDQSAADISAAGDRVRNELLKKIEPAQVIPIDQPGRTFSWLRAAAAIALIISLGTAAYFIFLNKGEKKEMAVKSTPVPVSHDIAAGTNKAVLTLADGTRIELDEKSKGSLLKQGPVSVTNYEGQLIYEKKDIKQSEVEYNTLTSARGQSYSLVLADGTKLWLNAASSVRFPTAFTGHERSVEISGEVYFDVAKDPGKPFRVKTNGMELEVLGTQFDINAYPDESSVNATLVEGSVKVSAKNKDIRLSPGQQAQLSSNGNLQLLNKVNVDEIIAWKNGYFHFENADLRSILRQFSRWYDIEVVYEGELKNRNFLVIVSRNSSLSNVLKMLQANNIKFRIDGKKLIVQSF
jgi:ferric-dicitrate binding protein FerR (iron transport regulator)